MRRLVWLIAAIALSTPCYAQPAPSIGPNLTNSSTALTAQQKAEVAEYAKYYAKQLAGKETGAADAASIKLTAPLSVPGVTGAFRVEYASALITELDPIVEQKDNIYASMNAMKVVAQLQTTGALQLAVRHFSIKDESRESIRLWAAICFREASIELVKNAINARTVDTATRALARAALDETDWLVLLRQLQALGKLNTTVANAEELNVLESIVDRMDRQNGPSDLVHALFPAVVSLRNRMLNNELTPSQLASMGKRLGPILGKVLDNANKNWSEVQDDQDARSTYGKLISATERTITIVDRSVQPAEQRPPQTALAEWWDKRDQPKFDRDVKLWQTRLELPAYRAGM